MTWHSGIGYRRKLEPIREVSVTVTSVSIQNNGFSYLKNATQEVFLSKTVFADILLVVREFGLLFMKQKRMLFGLVM